MASMAQQHQHQQMHHQFAPPFVGTPGPGTGPSTSNAVPLNTNGGISPHETQHHQPQVQSQPQSQPQPQLPQQQQQQQHQQQQQQQQQQLASGSTGPLVATGDWTKDLVHLAKTAELKKHALTLQLHTAHILSAHASLEQKNKAIQDIREQKNKLESERNRLLNCLREINEDRDKADILESSITRECSDLRTKIAQLSEGEYAVAKADVDRLRGELGQPPLPTLQSTLDEKSAMYLNERRLGGDPHALPAAVSPSTPTAQAPKRSATEAPGENAPSGKRPRGRPKGSKNKTRGGVPL